MWQLETKIKLRALFSFIISCMGLNYAAVIGRSREKKFVMAKQIFVLMVDRIGILTNPADVAEVMHRDRATAYTALKAANTRIDYDPEFREYYNLINVKGGFEMINTGKMIKEVTYNVERRALTVEFADGSKFGEIGSIAQQTFMKMQENKFEIKPIIKQDLVIRT